DDRAVQTDDVELSAVRSNRRRQHHVAPPAVADVVLEQHAERTVVPEPADSTVDLGGLKDESSPPAERDDRVHALGRVRDRLRHPSSVRGPSWESAENMRIDRARQRRARPYG